MTLSSTLTALLRVVLSFWIGGAALFTFILTPLIFKAYPRDTAGQIVGVLFPGYFRWGLVCGIVALVALVFLRGRNFVPMVILLLVMLIITSVQAFVIEPRAAALKREIPSFETTPKDNPLRREFSRLHGISAAGNLGVIGGGVVLLVLL